MSFSLTNSVDKSYKVFKRDITSFTPVIKTHEMYIAFDELDSSGSKVGEDIITTDGVDFQNLILRASQIAGVDIYAPLKQALYEEVERQTGDHGVLE